MKEKYEELEVIYLELQDVITESTGDENETPGVRPFTEGA